MPPAANLVQNAQRSQATGFEALMVIRLLWREGGPVSFDGLYFGLEDAVLGLRSRLGRSQALELLDRVPATVAESATLHGTVEEVAEQLQDYHAARLQHVVLWNVTFFGDASLVRTSCALMDRVRQLLTQARVA